jgi:hypothetical protein
MQNYMESSHSEQPMQGETNIMVNLMSIKKIQESAIISIWKWVTWNRAVASALRWKIRFQIQHKVSKAVIQRNQEN